MWCQVSSLDHRLAFATKASGKQRLSGTKSPRQGHRHCLSQSVTNGTVFTIGASHQEGSPSPHKVSLPLHTKSEGHTTSTRLLAAARLCSRLISQDQVLPSTKLLKLTLVLSYSKFECKLPTEK